MPYKDKAKQLECQRRYYARNPDLYKGHKNRRKKETSTLIREMKENPCVDCGIQYPYYVMEFDHLPGRKKTCHPANIATRGWGVERVKDELGKCELVCSNCHRERTHNRRKKRVHGEMAS
jgi:hypothetical protein